MRTEGLMSFLSAAAVAPESHCLVGTPTRRASADGDAVATRWRQLRFTLDAYYVGKATQEDVNEAVERLRDSVDVETERAGSRVSAR
jgi:hypothetical protein